MGVTMVANAFPKCPFCGKGGMFMSRMTATEADYKKPPVYGFSLEFGHTDSDDNFRCYYTLLGIASTAKELLHS